MEVEWLRAGLKCIKSPRRNRSKKRKNAFSGDYISDYMSDSIEVAYRTYRLPGNQANMRARMQLKPENEEMFIRFIFPLHNDYIATLEFESALTT